MTTKNILSLLFIILFNLSQVNAISAPYSPGSTTNQDSQVIFEKAQRKISKKWASNILEEKKQLCMLIKKVKDEKSALDFAAAVTKLDANIRELKKKEKKRLSAPHKNVGEPILLEILKKQSLTIGKLNTNFEEELNRINEAELSSSTEFKNALKKIADLDSYLSLKNPAIKAAMAVKTSK